MLQLESDGTVIKEVSIVEALSTSGYANLLPLNPDDKRGDILHADKARVLTKDNAAVLPFARPGQIPISLRDINTIAILDQASERITWATRGPWLFQHDPEILANGNLQVFDIWGHVGPGGASRVIEYDPLSRTVDWVYAGTRRDPLFSNLRSDAQRLPNGDTLISEFARGRILEVTRDGDVVWEFVNPSRNEDSSRIGAVGLDVRRFDEASLPFLSQEEPTVPPEERG